MKRFHELTKAQQQQAIEFAKKKIEETFEAGVVTSDRLITDAHVEEFAQACAETAFYSERHDMIVADIADGK